MMELYERLKAYADTDWYPWHMPGHKRQMVEFGNPFSMDITEIDGFDDLHHPDGILKEAMDYAAEIYGSEQTWFLVNGSSCGILAAISASVKPGGKILMARNCHKSAWHGALLQQSDVVCIYPEPEPEGFYGVLTPEAVEAALEQNPDTEAVVVVSPTYEGLVSDISGIAKAAHDHGCCLIVDEAHGAHFPYGKGLGFPESALEKGADLVIQSLHKTLPSLTQTALLHLGKHSAARISAEQVSFFLRIYQSSSPSYILMASIDHCIHLMAGEEGRKRMQAYAANLKAAREELYEKLKVLTLYRPAEEAFYDPSKFVITAPDGEKLTDLLRRDYHLEPEMHTERYVILMSSPADTMEGFQRMVHALLSIDVRWKQWITEEKSEKHVDNRFYSHSLPVSAPEIAVKSAYAVKAPWKWCGLNMAEGHVCHDFVYIYPPGIPLLIPGERIGETQLRVIRLWEENGLEVHGIRHESGSGSAIAILEEM